MTFKVYGFRGHIFVLIIFLYINQITIHNFAVLWRILFVRPTHIEKHPVFD